MRLPGNIRCSCGTIGPHRRARVFAVGIDGLAVLDDRQRLVRVDEAARVRHVARPLRVDVEAPSRRRRGCRSKSRACAARNSRRARRPDDLRLETGGADLRDVDDGDPGGGVEHQLVPLRRKRVVVKVERRTACIAGEPDDAMPRCGVDPVAVAEGPATTAPCPPTT